MVVGLGHEAHAVAEPDPLGAGGDGAVEHLGVRAVGVLLQEVVLDRPEGVPAEAVPGDRLLQGVAVGDELAVLPPGARDGDLVEQRELHGVGSPRRTVAPGSARARTVHCSYQPGSPGRKQTGRFHAWIGRSDLRRHRGRLGHRPGHGGPAARRGRPRHGGRRRRAGGRRAERRGAGPSPTSTSPTRARWRRWCGRRWPSGAPSTDWCNAAGVAGGGPVHMLPAEEWARVIAVNLTGTYLTAKHVIAQMLRQARRDDGLAGRGGDAGQHRGAGRHRGRQRLQRLEGRRGHPHQEHGHRLRRAAASGSTPSAPGSSRHR